MADGVKTYEIVINGLSQSISQVDALNKKLEQLEKRMNSLPNGSVGGAGGSSKSELKEEEKLLQEIDKLNSKILATRTEEYKVTQQQKETLKESKKEVEETLAKERLLSKQYDNTIKGWKQELKDVKAVMQSMNPDDVGFDELTQRADELNTKLKNVEQSYGQFGRNVGNYQNDIEKALKNVTVTVGGVERQFNSTKDASRTLKEELKAMSVNGQENTEEFRELSNALEEFEHRMGRANSAVNDLKKSSGFMDSALDMGQSFTAIGQVTKGFGSIFGLEKGAIDEEIKELVALQNAMMGLEKIQQQMITGEGIGKYLSNIKNSFSGLTTAVDRYNITFDKARTSTQAQKVVLGELANGMKNFGGAVLDAASKMATMFVLFEGWQQFMVWLKGAGKTITENKAEFDKLYDEERLKSIDAMKTSVEGLNKAINEEYDLMADAYGEMNRYVLLVASGNQEVGGLHDAVTALNTGYREQAEIMKAALSTKEKEIEIDGKHIKSYKEAIEAAEEYQKMEQTEENQKKKALALSYALMDFYRSYKKEMDEANGNMGRMSVVQEKYNKILENSGDLFKMARENANLFINDPKTAEGIQRFTKLFDRMGASVKTFTSQLKEFGNGFKSFMDKVRSYNQSKLPEEEVINRQIKVAEMRLKMLERLNRLFKHSYDSAIEDLNTYIANLRVDLASTKGGGGGFDSSSAANAEVVTEKEIEAFKISLMQEGKEKELAVLEEARKAKAEEAKKLGQDVNAVTEYYAKEKEKIEKKYADAEEQRKKNNLQEISQLTTQLLQLDLETAQTTEEKLAAIDKIEEDNARNINAYYDERIAKTQALIGEDEEENETLREQIRLYEELRGKSLLKNYNNAQQQRDSLATPTKSRTERINEAVAKVAGEVNKYTQALGGALQSYLSSFYSYEDSLYQAMIESIDKDIDKAREKYEALSDLAKEHADNVNSIESELANARGDRREALIDQLNAEMAAQRAKVEEERQAQEEMKKLEAKKEQEELNQRKKEQKRAETQAIISGALAIANGFATYPFIPDGLAMGALATVLTAAQVALIKKQKFADGGLLEGRSHAQGGIPVGNTNIEVEGGEYVTNKHTTEKNLDVLTFINSKRRKLDMGDFIDFYSSGKAGRNLNSAMPKTRFADGGSIPTLRNDIDLGTRLYDTLDAYANRPVYVSVVDINRKQADVRNVKVLAGLEA